MGGGFDIGGKVAPGWVAVHMEPGFPELARADIDDPSFIGDISGPPVLSAELGQRFRIEFVHDVLSRRRISPICQLPHVMEASRNSQLRSSEGTSLLPGDHTPFSWNRAKGKRKLSLATESVTASEY